MPQQAELQSYPFLQQENKTTVITCTHMLRYIVCIKPSPNTAQVMPPALDLCMTIHRKKLQSAASIIEQYELLTNRNALVGFLHILREYNSDWLTETNDHFLMKGSLLDPKDDLKLID